MKWHNTKFMLRHMKIIVGLMTILTAVALGFVLHLASGVIEIGRASCRERV